MKYTAVLPFAFEPYKDDCMSTCGFENVLLIDNTVNNRGIMKSHNMGIDLMKKNDSDWLIVMSAAIRFGRQKGLDFIGELEKAGEQLVLEAVGVYGWHLIAFSRKVIENVGRWDENFSPYGYDDLDYAWRIQKAFGSFERSRLWNKVYVAVGDMGMAHSIHRGGIKTQAEYDLRKYYISKWGGMSGKEYYDLPFNNSVVSIKYWPETKEGGKWND